MSLQVPLGGIINDQWSNGPTDPILHMCIIDYYNPSRRIIDLIARATYVVCVNFIYTWLDLQFKTDFKRQIFEKLFHGMCTLLSEILPEICWE